MAFCSAICNGYFLRRHDLSCDGLSISSPLYSRQNLHRKGTEVDCLFNQKNKINSYRERKNNNLRSHLLIFTFIYLINGLRHAQECLLFHDGGQVCDGKKQGKIPVDGPHGVGEIGLIDM